MQVNISYLTKQILNHCLNLQYNYVYIQIETDENKLVIVEDVPENTTQEQNHQNHRFYCLPCKQNFSESDDYTKHISGSRDCRNSDVCLSVNQHFVFFN